MGGKIISIRELAFDELKQAIEDLGWAYKEIDPRSLTARAGASLHVDFPALTLTSIRDLDIRLNEFRETHRRIAKKYRLEDIGDGPRHLGAGQYYMLVGFANISYS